MRLTPAGFRRLIEADRSRKEQAMIDASRAPLEVSDEERELLTELLESERAKLIIEIRHTDHRSYRNQLRDRLGLVERLTERYTQN
jgi:hypothetical protein